MKNKFLLGLVIGILLGAGGVYASTYLASDITYRPSDSNWNVNNVGAAIDDLYTKYNGGSENQGGSEPTPSGPSSTAKVCELKSGTALTVGSKYECDPGDGTKRNFFVLALDGDNAKLIMERNITDGTDQKKIDWNTAMAYFDTGAGKTYKDSWTNVISVGLPGAQDIANAVGNTSWDVTTAVQSNWFYLDPSNGTYGQTKVVSSSRLSDYRWLYNYTRACNSMGCDSATSLDTGETDGYWTSDLFSNDSTAAWNVARLSRLGGTLITNATVYGVRPVITVYKTNLQ